MTPIRFTLAAGEARRFDAPGYRFEYQRGAGGDAFSSLAVMAGDSNFVPLLPGDAIDLPEQVNAWAVRNDSSAPLLVVLLIGNFVLTRRIPEEADLTATRAGRAFAGGVNMNAGAGQYPQAQLWNPAGSGVRLRLVEVTCSSYNTFHALAARSTAALATSNGNGLCIDMDVTPVSSVAELRTAAPVSTPAAPWLWFHFMGAGPMVRPVLTPILIEPGVGLLLSNYAANTQLGCGFVWIEEAL